MAAKGALSSISKLTPAYGLKEGETDDAVERATQRVMQAYSARQNLGYDPVLMGFGQAMLASKGNFGEGLGAGLKGAQEAQQKTRELDIEEAQAQLTMAQAQREQQNAARAAAAFRQINGSAPAGPTGLPANGVSSSPVTGGPIGQQGNAPAGMRPITLEMARSFREAFPKDKENNAFLMDAAKMYAGRFLAGDQGFFDTMANGGRGAFVDLPMRNQKPYDYSTVGGTLSMTPGEYDNYKMAVSKGLGKQWVDAYKAGESTNLIEEIASGKKGIMSLPAPEEVMKGQVSSKPKVEGPAAAAEPKEPKKEVGVTQTAVNNYLSQPVRPNGILSKEQQEFLKRQGDLDVDIAKEKAKSQIEIEKIGPAEAAKQEAARRIAVVDKSDVARESIAIAQQFRKLSEDPAAAKIMGVFSNNKVFSAIIDLVEGGIGTRDYSLGIPGLSEIVKKLDLDPAEMRTAQTMAMLVAQMQLSNGKLLKGSTSNYETQLMGMAGVTNKDIPESVRTKADMLERKAMFHRDESRMLNKFKGSLFDFYDSSEYEDMFKKYLIELTGIASGELKLNPAYGKPSAAPAGKKVRDIEGAAKKLQ